MQPSFRIAEIELLEIPVVLRMPFRFGVVTLRQCFQAFVRARIVMPDGHSHWGASAEMIVPKWFDKNTQLSDEDNFEQERHVLRLAKAAYLADGSPDTAFGHFARHHEAHLRACAAENLNPLLANYGPALIDRALIDALCRALGQSFYAAVQHNTLGIDEGMPSFKGLNMAPFLASLKPATTLHARHTVGLLDAITRQDVTEPVNDGLPETLQEVLQVYGHRFYKLKVSGRIDADIERLCAIASVLDSLPEPYHATLDGNEQYQNAEQLLELLTRMRAQPALQRLVASILFIEQPINRLHALDVEKAYGYPDETMRALCGASQLPDRLNVGLCGLRGEDIDWQKLERWTRGLIERHGTHYYLEQALVAMLVAERQCTVAPESDYVTGPRPPEAGECRAVMHHYVSGSKRWYFRDNWCRVAGTGLTEDS
jgi:hypothetical protein